MLTASKYKRPITHKPDHGEKIIVSKMYQEFVCVYEDGELFKSNGAYFAEFKDCQFWIRYKKVPKLNNFLLRPIAAVVLVLSSLMSILFN